MMRLGGLYVQVPMLLYIADFVIRGLSMLILVSAIMSWFSPDPQNPIVKGIHAIVQPLLHPFQVLIPPLAGMDFSPMIVLLLLSFLRGLLIPGSSFF